MIQYPKKSHFWDDKWQQLVPSCKLQFISNKIFTDFVGKNVL